MTDYSKQYFTTVALSDGTINFNGSIIRGTYNKLMYSKDGGKTWSDASYGSTSIGIVVNSGDRVLWKGHARPQQGIGKFESSAHFSVEGNVMSLLFGDEFKDKTDLSGYDGAFGSLFASCYLLVSAENLVLPATTLSRHCYVSMFHVCTSLTKAPKLPATTLASGCYYYMFYHCTRLTAAPELPATTLSEYCYADMFSSCTNLTTAPELPATTLTQYCYSYMFHGCTSLTAAPLLPATTLANRCYQYMFCGCLNLEKTKLLFINKSDKNNVHGMYCGCDKLKYNPIIVKL